MTQEEVCNSSVCIDGTFADSGRIYLGQNYFIYRLGRGGNRMETDSPCLALRSHPFHSSKAKLVGIVCAIVSLPAADMCAARFASRGA